MALLSILAGRAKGALLEFGGRGCGGCFHCVPGHCSASGTGFSFVKVG